MSSPDFGHVAIALALTLAFAGIARAAPRSSAAPSLYDFDARFTDQSGHTETLAQLGKGHPVLVSMFYATCPAACPLLINKIQQLEAKLTPEQRANVRVVMVTFDPKRDDVAALAQVQKDHQLDGAHWSLLRVDDAETVRSLAAVLGIKYRFLPNGMINHASVITYVAPDGTLGPKMDGLDADETAVLGALRQAK